MFSCRDQLVEELDKILAKQQNRLEILRNSFGTASDASLKNQIAIAMAKMAIEQSIDKAFEQQSLNPVLRAVSSMVAVYRQKYYDPMQFGKTTFNTIVNDLLDLQRRTGEKTVYSSDQLMDVC
ncbi:hypothetical protein KF728_02120 [Candidatus Obscuribacterales bacterium]|nr:hypothetical protein [Candidatus Obscuribacterales bacterium]